MIDSGLIRFRGNIVKGIGYGFHPPPKKTLPLSHISLHRTVFSIPNSAKKFGKQIFQLSVHFLYFSTTNTIAPYPKF